MSGEGGGITEAGKGGPCTLTCNLFTTAEEIGLGNECTETFQWDNDTVQYKHINKLKRIGVYEESRISKLL